MQFELQNKKNDTHPMFSFKEKIYTREEYSCIFIFINTLQKLVHLKNTKTCTEIESLHKHP